MTRPSCTAPHAKTGSRLQRYLPTLGQVDGALDDVVEASCRCGGGARWFGPVFFFPRVHAVLRASSSIPLGPLSTRAVPPLISHHITIRWDGTVNAQQGALSTLVFSHRYPLRSKWQNRKGGVSHKQSGARCLNGWSDMGWIRGRELGEVSVSFISAAFVNALELYRVRERGRAWTFPADLVVRQLNVYYISAYPRRTMTHGAGISHSSM